MDYWITYDKDRDGNLIRPVRVPVNRVVLERKIRAIARLMPDYVYAERVGEGCYYYPTDGKPHGCIVGAALSRMGFEPARMDANGVSVSSAHWLGLWAGSVQVRQDRGDSWAESVGCADRVWLRCQGRRDEQ